MLNQHTPTLENLQEEWRAVVGYEGLYEVSSLGRVRRSGHILKNRLSRTGYPYVSLCVHNKSRNVSVHRLVALAYLGDEPSGHEVNHKDSDRTNASLSNLEYVTRKQNIRHAFDVGGRVMPKGSATSWARLTETDVEAILLSPQTRKTLAARYGVSLSTIHDIYQGASWRHVAPEIVRVKNPPRRR